MCRALIVSTLALALVGCAKPAAEQCLNSFRSSLKDPESGKVIAFADDVLTYTATNSYGARTQGKAICKQTGGNWSRDHFKENLMVLNRTAKVLEEFNNCRESGGTKETCSNGSISLRFQDSDGVNVEKLTKEVARTLGFE